MHQKEELEIQNRRLVERISKLKFILRGLSLTLEKTLLNNLIGLCYNTVTTRVKGEKFNYLTDSKVNMKILLLGIANSKHKRLLFMAINYFMRG